MTAATPSKGMLTGKFVWKGTGTACADDANAMIRDAEKTGIWPDRKALISVNPIAALRAYSNSWPPASSAGFRTSELVIFELLHEQRRLESLVNILTRSW